jgi:hypothetical protein
MFAFRLPFSLKRLKGVAFRRYLLLVQLGGGLNSTLFLVACLLNVCIPFAIQFEVLKRGCAFAGTFAVLNEMRSRRASTFFKKPLSPHRAVHSVYFMIQSTSATPEMLRELRETLGPVLT